MKFISPPSSTTPASATLLGLPPELRNQIYHFVSPALIILDSNMIAQISALVAVCRQTNHEYPPILHDYIRKTAPRIEVRLERFTALARLETFISTLKPLRHGESKELHISISLCEAKATSEACAAELKTWMQARRALDVTGIEGIIERKYHVTLKKGGGWTPLALLRLHAMLRPASLPEHCNGSDESEVRALEDALFDVQLECGVGRLM